MTNPTITISLFHKADKNADCALNLSMTVYSTDDQAAHSADVLDHIIQMRTNEAVQPRLWSFAQWQGKHRKQDFKGATAVVLEYSTADEQRLRFMLRRMRYAHYLVKTETVTENRIAAVFPLAQPFNSEEYSRAASLLADELNVYGLTEGSASCTFLIQPRPNTTVEFNDGEFLDPAFLAANAGKWVKADKFTTQRTATQVAQTAMPAATMQTDDTGLFSFPA